MMCSVMWMDHCFVAATRSDFPIDTSVRNQGIPISKQDSIDARFWSHQKKVHCALQDRYIQDVDCRDQAVTVVSKLVSRFVQGRVVYDSELNHESTQESVVFLRVMS